MLEAFARRLRGVRLEFRMDQATFANLGGVKSQSQLNYEAAKTAPTIEYLLKLEPHGVDIGYILTGRRMDQGLDFEQALLYELFGKLSAREREGVMSLLMHLAGQTVSTAELGAKAREARESLHDRRLGFRGAPPE